MYLMYLMYTFDFELRYLILFQTGKSSVQVSVAQ